MRRSLATPRCASLPCLEGIQDEVKADGELLAKVIAGAQDVLDRELGEVWVLGCRAGEDLLGQLGRLRSSLEWQARLLQGEAVGVAVEQRVGVGRQRDREPGGAKAPQHSVVMPKDRKSVV